MQNQHSELPKIAIFGNSGSGKSTLAQSLSTSKHLAHLDLDNLAWLPTTPPQRMPLNESQWAIKQFTNNNNSWVIEGCYTDLLDYVLDEATEIIYLDIPIDQCVENAKQRPWEPHKYSSKEAQDENLDMLIDWIKDYQFRDDVFSKAAHDKLFNDYSDKKIRYTDKKDYSM